MGWLGLTGRVSLSCHAHNSGDNCKKKVRIFLEVPYLQSMVVFTQHWAVVFYCQFWPTEYFGK